MGGRTFSVVFALLALVTLTASECVIVARSGGSSQDDDEQTSNLVVIIREGRLVDAPVEGVRYRCGSLSGITGPDGSFQYQVGEPVRFSIGDIALGRAPQGKALITPVDLVPGGNLDSTAVINIARLLQSLDSVPGDARITIPPGVRLAAAATRGDLSAAIQFLDFSDDTAFANAASQLVATLTAGYPFTAVLVDARSARMHLQDALAAAGIAAAGAAEIGP